MRPEELGTILGVWGHPDDETYLSAGIMAAAAANGQRVVCVTATRGEKGSWDEERWPSATMGEVRERELLESLAILGLTEHRFLEYVDAECAGVDPEEATARVEATVREVSPDTVLSFGPDGMTGHPDHRAVSAWTSEAFRRAARPGATLHHATVTPGWYETYKPRFDRFEVFGPGTPPITEPGDLSIRFALPPDLVDRKLAAIEAHESQVVYMLEAFGQDFFRQAHKEEYFRLAVRA